MCVWCMHYAVWFSKLLSHTSTLKRKHILRAKPMFASGQTVVVGFSRISCSLSSRKRAWHHFFIPHASFHHCGGLCCKNLKSLRLTQTSEPGHLCLLSTRDMKHLSAWNHGACVRKQKHFRLLVLTLLFKSASRGLHFSQQSFVLRPRVLKLLKYFLLNLLCPYFSLHWLQM